jgi:two-component system, sensor histidine kinase RpfC
MSLRASLKAHISASSGPELEHAILRIAILSIVTLYATWFVSHLHHGVPSFGAESTPWTEDDKLLVGGLASWLVVALGIFAVVWMSPAANRARRVLGMVADVGAITFGLLLAGKVGAVLVGTYLFLIFGNGFRYGRAYLHMCQFLSLAGFGLVVSMVPWWQHEWDVVAGWMVLMIVLPSYVGALVGRIDAARLKAEEALKQCVERGRRVAA